MNRPLEDHSGVGTRVEAFNPAASAAPAPKRDVAYEVKIVLPSGHVSDVLAWARERLDPDPHASTESGGDGYGVTSLYFDTPGLDTYHRRDGFRKRKYRIRRYGEESRLFLERKLKSSGLVRKRRTMLSLDQLFLLEQTLSAALEDEVVAAAVRESAWPGQWFLRQLVSRRLMPGLLVTYDRVARVGKTPEGPIRLTLDRDIRCQAPTGMAVAPVANGITLQEGECVLELKFQQAMPAMFKELLREFRLSPGKFSKYRQGVERCALSARADDSLR